MHGMRKSFLLTALCLTAIIAMPVSSLAAPIYSDIYVFGDSLSDTGNTEVQAPGGDIPGTDFTYGTNSRFSNGRVWVEYLSETLGLGYELEPFRRGGTNYAHGGAAFDHNTGPETGLLTQYQLYLNGRGTDGSDPDALYVVWAGSNDLRDNVTPGSDPLAVITQSMNHYRNMLSGLIANGAEHLLVPNLPNLGRTPEAAAAGISAEATQLALLWNGMLAGMLAELSAETDANIYAYDAYGVIEGIFANLEGLGFTNASDPCSHVENNVEIPCANPDQYIFWDILHPTTAAHELIGEGAYELLAQQQPPTEVPLPSTVWLMMPGLALLLGYRRANSGASKPAA